METQEEHHSFFEGLKDLHIAMTNIDGQILARWQGSLEDACCTTLMFLEMVQDTILEKELSNISFSYITRREGGWFSPERVYLRIRCKRLYFDTSAFVAGNSLIVSWWLHRDAPGVADLLSELPGVGHILEKTTRAATYYTVDYIEYFQRSVHESIIQSLDNLSEQNELPYLPETEGQPVWEEIW